MSIFFTGLAILLAIYVAYAVATGGVIAKSGHGARRILREETPRYFWTVIAIYAALAIALATVF